ncbi:equilibrative Nucleoside Transporter (ENT) family [Phytophthora infestans T30-4]|uniref:Equilibrative Nucleoside Transporter (ENT) family n=1 Tax=Phytophthora infestans (strain T30-4) TaxID=403677 RepID=D0MYS8_PHYIT|nr:equilibrative Nucleoside Transporter (ENT) family [Phytophthora infestans T30-4]EEY66326.1 equilibrative Nucleoside Transporter (ENT) family [Phytophthora infestans T30-4]|eukprot:XP_002906925.1 equilibrative Nucleoside Transporter (ENT) family [Phytophthora infestans T30-4]
MALKPPKSLTLDLEAPVMVENTEPELPVGNLDDRAGLWITYCAFFFSGAGSIAMWSCITLCLAFFDEKYPEDRVGFVFPVVNMSTLLVISLYMVMAGRQLSLDARMHGSLAAYASFVLLFPLASVVALPHDVGYPLTLLTLMGSTISSSIMQSTMYGLGGVFGPMFIQAIEGGKGFGAILLFAVRLALKWYLEGKDSARHDLQQQNYYAKLSMGVFFGVALIVVMSTWVLYWALLRTRFAQPLLTEYALVQLETPLTPPMLSPLSSPVSPMRRSNAFFARDGVNERSPLLANSMGVRNGGTLNNPEDDADDEEDAFEIEEELEEHAAAATVMNVLHTALKPFFSLFFSYFVCLSCFPGIISAIPSVTLGLGDWFPIVLVGCYNLGDLVGKNLPMYAMYFDVSTLHLPWPFQLSFLPLFMAALVHPFEDITIIVAVLLLGLTTGYVATSSIIIAPSICSEYQKEVAGMVGGLSSIIGLCAGSYNGLAMEAIVQFWTGDIPQEQPML